MKKKAPKKNKGTKSRKSVPKKSGPKKSGGKAAGGRLKTRAKKTTPTKTKGSSALTNANKRIKRLQTTNKNIKQEANKKIKRLQADKKQLREEATVATARKKDRKHKPSTQPLFVEVSSIPPRNPNWNFANGGPSPMPRPQPVIIPEVVEARAETALALRSDTSLTVEKKAEAITGGKGRLATAIRAVGSRRALKISAAESLGFGLIDSTKTFALIEDKVVRKLGIGWKGVFGGLALVAAVIGEAAAESAMTPEQFINRSEFADWAAQAAIPAISFELYNMGVTRFGRVKAALEGKDALLAEEEAAEKADASADVEEAKGVIRRIAKRALVKKISQTTVNPENAEQIAALIGIPEEDLALLLDAIDEDDDDDDDDDNGGDDDDDEDDDD